MNKLEKRPQISVSIIEDHHDIREGMSFLINSHENFFCTSFSSAEDALKEFDECQPDIVLMDIHLPGMSGISCTEKIKEKFPAILIMMVTVYEDDEKIFKALKAGASGYILKRAAASNLLDCIRDLYNGGSPMSSTIARKVIAYLQREPKISQALNVLSKRENEILDLLALGYRNKEIADKLSLSINTVRTHIYHIYEKLHVQSRVEALNKTGRYVNPF